MFKKLQEVVGGKKERNYSLFDDAVGRDRNITIGDIEKLKASDLVDIIRKYDSYIVRFRRETTPMIEQHPEVVERLAILEQQIKQQGIEYDEINQQLESLQLMLNSELSKNLSLSQACELAKKQNQHLKKLLEERDSDPAYNQGHANKKVVINADSELLMFMTQDELQQLRNLFEQLQADSADFVHKLQNEGMDVTGAEAIKRINAAQQEAKKKKQQKQGRQHDDYDGEEEEESSYFEDEEEGDEEEEEEDLTLEELCGNTWDSLTQLNEQLAVLVAATKDDSAKRNNAVIGGKEVIANLEAQLAFKQKQIESLIVEKERAIENGRLAVKDAKQAENEVMTFNERLMDERVKRAELEDRVQVSSKQLIEVTNEREQFISMINQVNEENRNLKLSVLKMEDICQEEDAKAKEEIEELSKELDEVIEENEELKKELQKAQEDLFLKTKEIDNKDRQEKLKIAQTQKEIQKLEAKVAEGQEDLTKQAERSHDTMQKLKALEEKRVLEKTKMKALKDRAKILSEELSRKKLENANDIDSMNKMLFNLEDEVKMLREKTNLKDELKKLTLDKDLRISVLENQLSEECQQALAAKETATQLQKRIDEELTEKISSQEKMIKSLQEKRELGLKEIQKLNAQIDMIKSYSNPTTQAKMAEIQNILDKAQNYTQSAHSLVHPSQNQAASGKFFVNLKSGGDLSGGNAKNINQPGNSVPVSSANLNYSSQRGNTTFARSSTSNGQEEFKHVNLMKKEMEAVYKEYISIAFDFENHSTAENKTSFMKLEKKINLSIKKAQDLMDAIEDNA